MKIYILQEDYESIDPEGIWDEESGGYDMESYKCADVLGVFPTLEDAVRSMVETYTNVGSSDYTSNRDNMNGYKILVADTETTKVKNVGKNSYEDMARQMVYDKQFGVGVVKIGERKEE